MKKVQFLLLHSVGSVAKKSFIFWFCFLHFSGLDDVILPYAHFFHNNNVSGQGLLNLTVDDLYKLHVEKLGHQEIILEALDMLKSLVSFLNWGKISFPKLFQLFATNSSFQQNLAEVFKFIFKKNYEVVYYFGSTVLDLHDLTFLYTHCTVQ